MSNFMSYFYTIHDLRSPDLSVKILISEAGGNYRMFTALTDVIILKRC
jgi:hypothetical protein